MYKWSLSDSVSTATLHCCTRRAADREAHDKSTIDSPCQRTQVLWFPLLSRCRSSSAAHSSTASPLVHGEPHSVDLALKSPRKKSPTKTSWAISGATQSRALSSSFRNIVMGAFGDAYSETIAILPHNATTKPRFLTIVLRAGEAVNPILNIAAVPVRSLTQLGFSRTLYGSDTAAIPISCSVMVCSNRSCALAE